MAVWDKSFWKATAERVISTVAAALLGVVTVDGLLAANFDWKANILLVVVPGVGSFLKCIIANTGGTPGPSIGGQETLGTRVG